MMHGQTKIKLRTQISYDGANKKISVKNMILRKGIAEFGRTLVSTVVRIHDS